MTPTKTLKIATMLLLPFALTAVVAVGPTSAATADCPNMTGSITRLYAAWFNRAPDPTGYQHWTYQYAHGMSLETISAALEDSPENHAPANSHEFVDWMYRRLAPQIVPTRFDQWVAALDAGYPRSRAILSFTESEEYVTRTHTSKPLAGYLRWYPRGTYWYCGTGSDEINTPPLTNATRIDYRISNKGTTSSPVELWSERTAGQHWTRIATETLRPGYFDYQWDGGFAGSGRYGNIIDIQAGERTNWIVVVAPASIGQERLGW